MISVEEKKPLKWWINTSLSGNEHKQSFFLRHLKESSIHPHTQLQALGLSAWWGSLGQIAACEGLLVSGILKDIYQSPCFYYYSHHTGWHELSGFCVLFHATEMAGHIHRPAGRRKWSENMQGAWENSWHIQKICSNASVSFPPLLQSTSENLCLGKATMGPSKMLSGALSPTRSVSAPQLKW